MSAASTVTSLDVSGSVARAVLLYSLAEFQFGHATIIRVTAQGTSFSIADNGRGHSFDRAVDGTPYLKLIYSHFEYPFESNQSLPIQLQGIGMSLVNTMCSELAITVKKREKTLQLVFRDGKFHDSERVKVASDETGIPFPPPLILSCRAVLWMKSSLKNGCCAYRHRARR